MLFNSFHFVIFFALVVGLYYLVPKREQNALLFMASSFFYAVAIPKYILVLFLMIILDFNLGIAMDRAPKNARRLVMIGSLCANLGLLFVFKYWNFFGHTLQTVPFGLKAYVAGFPLLTWALPIGLSFHTFQSMSYIIEVYRKRIPPEKNLLSFALYIMFFPQLIAGPIERPQHFLPQLRAPHYFSAIQWSMGLRLILQGFLKKLLVADLLGNYVNSVFGDPTHQTGGAILVATYSFAFQIYADFSGYTDIARGCAQLLGFELSQNFNTPYLSTTLREFWRRWHISLSTWFRDYVYFPLGGGRCGLLRTSSNLLFVFILSGLWHGANETFLVWGGLHGLGLIASTFPVRYWRTPRLPNFLGWILTFNFVCLSWLPFRAQNMDQLWQLTGLVVKSPFNFNHPPTFIFVIICSFALYEGAGGSRRFTKLFFNSPVWGRWAIYYAALALLFCYARVESPHFIYFQF